MTQGEFPPPPPSGDLSMTREAAGSERNGRRQPWRKPTLHDLTNYLDTGGSPTDKDHMNNPYDFEDETAPPPANRKSYRPGSA